MEVTKNDVEKMLRNCLKSSQELCFYLKKINMKVKETIEVLMYQVKPRFDQNFLWEQFFQEFKTLLTSIAKGKQGNDFNAPSKIKTIFQLFHVFLYFYAYPKVNNIF